MRTIPDRGLLYLLCFAGYLSARPGDYAVLPALIVAIAGLCGGMLRVPHARAALFLACAAAGALWPSFGFFFPFLCYDVFAGRRPWPAAAACGVLLALWMRAGIAAAAWAALLCTTALLIAQRTAALEQKREESARLLDDARETQRRLARQNSELILRQDDEVRMATLAERNRIARDIHDTVGHLLSSAILQTGALLAVADDPALRERLQTLRHTLSRGMDSIRADIHGLYDQSVDLEMETARLVKTFTFCPVSLEYDVDAPPPAPVRYALLFVLKESLANIARHSHAKTAQVLLREHPGFYQLVVHDDGQGGDKPAAGGLGLRGIAERVETLGGRAHFEAGGGFTVFVIIPKGAVP